MKYFIFIDKNNFSYSQAKIWKSALNIQTWPKLWKHVISISTHTDKALSTSSKISCHLRLCYYINLNFIVHITCLKPSYYASFEFFSDFTDQGRWISRQTGDVTSSALYLRLRPHHKFLRIINYFPFGNSFILYTHMQIMLEGKR